jgi:predicted nucleotidyltransferase
LGVRVPPLSHQKKVKTLCTYLGGSHLYGMNTASSDIDERGVFINTDPLYTFGFQEVKTKVVQTDERDSVMHELVQFLRLATKSNTQTLECLFAPKSSFVCLDSSFQEMILHHRQEFLNTDQLFKSLEGYLHNEVRLALGERQGRIGGKRKSQITAHGFSPKNFSHLFRLAECGRQFFLTGVYPVRLADFNPALHELCMSVKQTPEQWDVSELLERANMLRDEMRNAYNNMKESDKFKPNLDYIRKTLKYFYHTP